MSVTTTAHPRVRRQRPRLMVVGVALAAAALAGCGSRLGHQQFVAAGGGTIRVAGSGSGQAAGNSLAGGSSTGDGTATSGDGTSGDGTVGDGSAAGGTGGDGTAPQAAASDGATPGTATNGGQPNLATGPGVSTGGNGTVPGTVPGGASAAPGGVSPTGATASSGSGGQTGTRPGTTPPSGGAAASGKGTATAPKGGTGAAKSGGASGTGTGGSGGSGTGGGGSGGSGTGGGTGGGGGAAAGPVQTGDIIIGSVGDYSGVAGTAEAQGPVGLQVWAQNLNDNGGINGRMVKVIVQDDASSPSKAQSEIQDLVENQHVVAFAASIAQYTIAAQRPYLEAHGIPVIGGDIGVADWNQSPVLFPQGPASDTEFYLGAELASKYGVSKKIALMHCQEATVCSDAEAADSDSGKGYMKANGMQVVSDITFSLTQPDFTQECLSMQQAGAGMVTVVGDPNVTGRVASSCARQGYNPQFLSGSALVSPDQNTQSSFSNLIAGMPTLPFDGLNTPAANAYRTAFATYASDQKAGPGGSLGWTSGLLLEKALRIAAAQPGGVISSATILAAMGTIKGETLGGASVPLTFTAGQPSPDFRCEFVMMVSGGKWVTPQGDTPLCRP